MKSFLNWSLIVGAFIVGFVFAAILPALNVESVVFPISVFLLLLFYYLLIKPRLDSARNNRVFRENVKGFISGFMSAAPVYGYLDSALFLAESRIDSLKFRKNSPDDPDHRLYASGLYQEFGLSCIMQYAQINGIEALYDYCEKRLPEIRRNMR